MDRLNQWLRQSLFNRTSIISLTILLPIHLYLAKISGIFAFDDGTGVIWPSTGVFMAVVFIFGPKKMWLPIFICDLVANEFLYYHYWPASLLIAGIATIDYIVISSLILHFVRNRKPFERIADTLKFLCLVVPVPFVTSALSIAAQCLLAGSSWRDFLPLYRGWIASITTGMMIVSPVMICTWQSIQAKRWKLRKRELAEFLFVLSLLIVTGLTAFSGTTPVEYVMILPLIWAAIRFGPREASFLALVMSAIAIFQTLRGNGSFAQSEVYEAAILLQSFVVALTVATLVLSAAIQENRRANRNLRHANEDLEHRVEERTGELTEILRELKKTQAHLVQQEKMSGLGQMVAGVAHEINNPVNFIHGNIKYIESHCNDLIEFVQLYETHYPDPVEEIQEQAEELEIDFVKEDLSKTLSAMKEGTTRIKEIVLSLRNFSRMDEAECKAVDIHEGIESTLMILQHQIKASGDRPEIKIIRDFDQLPEIECYAGQLNQVFMNILVNGIDALTTELAENPDSDKILQIIIRTETRAESVVISIADNGTGISPEVKARIFDPFFTTKAVGKGTGMGMAISYQLVTEKHKGKIECFSDEGVGTEFVIELPIHLASS